jgi:hypothetical protein
MKSADAQRIVAIAVLTMIGGATAALLVAINILARRQQRSPKRPISPSESPAPFVQPDN